MPTFSNSKIECYENCPRKYKFNYIDKIERPEAPEGIEAFLGLRVHETLEKLYKDQKMAKIDPLEEILAFYKAEWEKKWNENVKINKEGFKPGDYLNSGLKQLTDYYERYKPFDQSYTLGLEQLIHFDLDKDGEYKMRGYVDRLAHNGKGKYEIHDYKTGQYSMTQQKADESRQLAIYQIYVEQAYTDAKEIELIWHFTVDNREVVSRRSRQELAALKRELMETIREIEADEQFKPHESRLCDWCEFVDICPAKKHGVQLEKKPKNEYLSDDGLKLVETYGKMYDDYTKEEGKLEAKWGEIEKVQEAILHFAKKKDVSQVFGRDYKVKVTIEDKDKFPGSADEGREEVEELVKKAGKWEEIASLSASKLAKAYKGWGDELVKKLKKFVRKEHVEKVSKPYVVEGEE
jgi:putative RecB family exonuclease